MSFLGPTWVDAVAGGLGFTCLIYLVLWSMCGAAADFDEDTLLYEQEREVVFDDADLWVQPSLANDERTLAAVRAFLARSADQQHFGGHLS